ncbi:hypothetical protein [Arthrobacter sp. JUb115]|uniref:hypothetical protein n=1 Tax=Arthrobacter sp. JUb115 TaxID=2485108 RepID=UPI001060791D|nr:hypothetical protein [Arthrobacter sp. JUb115]TDU30529.1 hypothetical protein EDF61_101490 [Arthrobacter sp. JUb115]
MALIHKKLVSIGVLIAAVGVVVSSLSPGFFFGLSNNLSTNDPLVTVPLTLLVTFCQMILAPFGATLAAIGVSKHLLSKSEMDSNE